MDSGGLSRVRQRIDAAVVRAGRTDPVRLVTVVKYASDDAVAAVVAAGAGDLGESRADALTKRSALWSDVSWHFVGRLQGNKVRRVRPVTDLLHSMDRPELVDYWAKGEAAPPPVLVQVNLAGEPQKGGIAPLDLQSMVERCARSGVEVRGLMTVPPLPERPGDSARWFGALREMRDRVAVDHVGLQELSMGMSEDFEEAIAEGATILRIGRAIFEPFRNEG